MTRFPARSSHPFEPRRELIEKIRSGNCVAFVGSGMTQPSMPSWQELLKALVERVDDTLVRGQLAEWLGSATTSREWEAIAEVIAKNLRKDGLARHVRSVLGARTIHEATRERLRKLRQIPFHLVLTTNFDDLLSPAVSAESEAFGKLLTMPTRPWWDNQALWRGPGGDRAVIGRDRLVKLHGDVSDPEDASLVFTTRSYRARVHETPGYRTFLKTLFATRTVLFMGFSFGDAYINDIRSEVLSTLRLAAAGRDPDYAILEDIPDVMATHLEENEALIPLRFDTRPAGRASGERDFSGFDRWLDAIHAKCSPVASLRERVSSTRLLWLDPHPKNNELGFTTLRRNDDTPGGAEALTVVETVEEAVRELGVGAGTRSAYNLVITHWGYQGEGEPSNAERLLSRMHEDDLRAPVIVFASGEHRDQNRPRALALGALAFTHTWPELFRTIDELVTDARRPRRRP